MYDLNNLQSLTAEQIISEEMIQTLWTESDDGKREALISKVEDRAAELKKKTDFTKMINAHKKQLKEEAKEQKQKAIAAVNERNYEYQTLIGDDLITYNTGKWLIDAEGVRQIITTETSISENMANRYPVYIARRFIDCETNIEKIEIVWDKDSDENAGNPRSLTVERSVIASRTEIVKLARYGFPIDSESARNLVTYLGDFEKLNGHIIQKCKSISKFGWYERKFIPYTDNPIFTAPPDSKRIENAISRAGDFMKWLNLAKKIRSSGRQEPLIYMAASLGSALIQIKGISPFIVNLYGTTGRGKTVNMMLAASVWGDPKSLMVESTSTINSLEQILGTLNNIPLMIDDLSKIQDDGDGKKSTNMIYRLTAGCGKSRLTKDITMLEPPKWANIILTNMERPLETDNMQGGALNRVLDFEIQDGYIFPDGNEVVTTVTQNYGFAGQIFIAAVTQKYDSIKGIIADYEKKIRDFASAKGLQKEEKQIIPLAVLLAADQLAEECLFHDGIHLDLDYCIGYAKDVESVSEMRRALEAVHSDIVINRQHYIPEADGEYKVDVYGQVTAEYIAITNSRFRKLAIENNFSSKQFTNWADKQQYLITEYGPRKDKRVAFNDGVQIYCRVFKKECFDAPECSKSAQCSKNEFMSVGIEQPEEPLYYD